MAIPLLVNRYPTTATPLPLFPYEIKSPSDESVFLHPLGLSCPGKLPLARALSLIYLFHPLFLFVFCSYTPARFFFFFFLYR